MRLPIWGGVLTATNSAEDIARHLLKINKGTDPTAAEIATAAQAISGQVQGTYLATLAATDANVAKIDLVGLAATGFEYPIGG
jgi:negative regulator of replication initiation